MTHLSDCGLHNPPALPPTYCTCGASPAFKHFGYDVSTDVFRWREESRESFVAQICTPAILRCSRSERAQETMVPNFVLIDRALRCGLVASELAEIRRRWEGAVVVVASELERYGILDYFSALDGGPLPPGLREAITALPDEAEIAAALAPWVEYHLAKANAQA